MCIRINGNTVEIFCRYTWTTPTNFKTLISRLFPHTLVLLTPALGKERPEQIQKSQNLNKLVISMKLSSLPRISWTILKSTSYERIIWQLGKFLHYCEHIVGLGIGHYVQIDLEFDNRVVGFSNGGSWPGLTKYQEIPLVHIRVFHSSDTCGKPG